MKTILIGIFLGIGFSIHIWNCSAQEQYFVHNGQFSSEDVVITLGDDVNVRQTPDLKGSVLNTLPIATRVEILEKINETEIRGFTAPWYLIRAQMQGKKVEGYVWGGLLTKSFDTLDAQTQTLFLYGIQSVDKEKGPEGWATITARVVRGNEEVKKLTVQGIGGAGTSNALTIYDHKGLKNVKHVIYISFDDSYCGGAFGNLVFFWTGTDLIHAFTLHDGADAPVWSSETLVFPSDPEGKPDQIKKVFEAGEWDDAAQKDIIEETTVEHYLWNGKSIIKK